MNVHISRSSLCFVALLLVPRLSGAQQLSAPLPQNGIIAGTVLDINGGVVPRATVVVKGAAAVNQMSTLASDSGFFQINDVETGEPLRVTVSAPGFAAWMSPEILLRTNQFFLLTNISLRLTTVQTTVSAVPPEQLAAEQVKAEETQKVFGFIPNFYVTYERNPAPLTKKLKFQLAVRSLVDPVTTAGFVLNAGIYQMAGYPSYHGGMTGYGQRLGASFAGGYTKIIIGDAVLPSLLHQDPRYVYQGTGTTRSRWMHAIASPFFTRGDDGRREFNFSDIGGDLASGAIANAYYPQSERGAGLVLSSALIGAGGRMANGIIQEFILRRVTSAYDPTGSHSSSRYP